MSHDTMPLSAAVDLAMAAVETAAAKWLAKRLAQPLPAKVRDVCWAEPGAQTRAARMEGAYRVPSALGIPAEQADAIAMAAQRRSVAAAAANAALCDLVHRPGPHREYDPETGSHRLMGCAWAPAECRAYAQAMADAMARDCHTLGIGQWGLIALASMAEIVVDRYLSDSQIAERAAHEAIGRQLADLVAEAAAAGTAVDLD